MNRRAFFLRWLPLVLWVPGTLRSDARALRWTSFAEARLDEQQPYDGDSFVLQTRRGRMIFRLYFVDAPETDLEFPERVREQGKYWGISDCDVLQLGREARDFARTFLRNGVRVRTRREDAGGKAWQPRFFAVIQAGEEDLAVELVRHGFARIYGHGTDLPDGTPMDEVWKRLRAAEAEAREQGRGGWKKRGGSPPSRLRRDGFPENAAKGGHHVQVGSFPGLGL